MHHYSRKQIDILLHGFCGTDEALNFYGGLIFITDTGRYISTVLKSNSMTLVY